MELQLKTQKKGKKEEPIKLSITNFVTAVDKEVPIG